MGKKKKKKNLLLLLFFISLQDPSCTSSRGCTEDKIPFILESFQLVLLLPFPCPTTYQIGKHYQFHLQKWNGEIFQLQREQNPRTGQPFKAVKAVGGPSAVLHGANHGADLQRALPGTSGCENRVPFPSSFILLETVKQRSILQKFN